MSKKFNIDGSLQVTEKIIVQGDLEVKGTTTTVNQETLAIKDNIIVTNAEGGAVPDTGIVAVTGDEIAYIKAGPYNISDESIINFCKQAIASQKFSVNITFSCFGNEYTEIGIMPYEYADIITKWAPYIANIRSSTYKYYGVYDSETDSFNTDPNIFGDVDLVMISRVLTLSQEQAVPQNEADKQLLYAFCPELELNQLLQQEAYAAPLYDADSKSLKIGQGYITKNSDGSVENFIPVEGAMQSIATRDDSIPNGSVVTWDSTNSKLVDSGVILARYIFSPSGQNQYEITGCTNRDDCTHAIIPYRYNGCLVTKINDMVFNNCDSLESVVIKSDVFIGKYAFSSMSLRDVTITGKTTIEESAFEGCPSLTNITLSEGVTSIDTAAFAGAGQALRNIVIPASVQSIGDWAFCEQYSLTNVTLKGKTPPTLGEEVFSDSPIEKIIVPIESVEAYKNAEGWSAYADKIVGVVDTNYLGENYALAEQVENLENKLVKDTLVVEDTYNKRTTAKGGEFLSGSKVTLNSAVGDSKVIKDIVNEDGSVTPACKNLFNLAGMTFTAQTPSNLNINNSENGLIIECLTTNGPQYFSSTDVDQLHLKPNTTYAIYSKVSIFSEQPIADDSMQGSLWLQTNGSWDSANRICIAGFGTKYSQESKEYISFGHFTTPADLTAYTNVTSCMRGIIAITFKEVMIIEDNDNIYNADNFLEYHPYFVAPQMLHRRFAGIESKNVDGTGTSFLNFPSTDFKWGMTIDFDNKKIIDQGADIVLTGDEEIKYYYYSGNNSISIDKFTPPGNKHVADFICTHTDKKNGDYAAGSMWCGYNNTRSFYWIGVLDILGYTTKGTQATSEEQTIVIESFRQYLREEAAKGTPVTVRYLTKEARETPFSGGQAAMDNTYTAWVGGTEKVLGNTSYEYGLVNSLTQTYLLNDSLIDRIDTAEKIAKGASKAISFDSYSEMINAFNGLSNDKYNIGQNIMIVTHGVPDLWIAGISDMSISYNYTSDEEFVNKLSTNIKIQVGYYIFSDLETQKLYDDDYATIEYVDNAVANAGSGGNYYEKVDGINIGDNFVKGIISSNGIFTSDSLSTGLYGDELWLKDKAGTSPNKVYASISYDGTDDKLKYTGNPSIANHNLATEEYVDNMVANAGSGGGTKLYKHDLLIMGGGARIYPTIISSFATAISNYEDLAQAVQKGFVAYASGSSDGISTDIKAGTLTVGSASIDLLSYVDNKNISISMTGATIMDGVPIEL